MTAAIAAQRRGDLEAAEAGYQTVLSKGVRHPILLSNLAALLRRKQRTEEAERLLREVIQSNPGFISAYINLGSLLIERGALGDAQRLLVQALKLQPESVDALVNLGIIFYKQNLSSQGARLFKKALKLRPDNVDALVRLASISTDLLNYEQAFQYLGRAFTLDPNHLEGLCEQARLLEETDQPKQAMVSWRHAVKIGPDFGPALLGLAGMLIEQDGENGVIEARSLIEHVLVLRPHFCEAHIMYSSLLIQLGDPKGAVTAMKAALKADPENLRSQEIARNNMGVLLLSAGDYSRISWELYEARWQAPGMHVFRHQHLPRWDGSKLLGSLLVSREQGIGDEVFYLGMVRELIEAGHRLVLEVSPRIIRMIKPSFLEATVVPKDTPLDDLDIEAVLPLGSVGLHCRNDDHSFAYRHTPYLQGLSAAGLIDELPPVQRPKLKVGLVWRSNSKRRGFRKSVSLVDLVPLTQLSSVCFISLQHQALSEDEQGIIERSGIYCPNANLYVVLESLSRWINVCDLVITVSTSTAHIACAMGAKTWILLPFRQSNLWYWGSEGEASVWYPTARLLRQPRRGDWPSLINQIGFDLQSLAGYPRVNACIASSPLTAGDKQVGQ